MDAFARYAPFIQDYIYRSGWTALRAVQNAAAEALFETDDNVLISASTASGKTEAAFFPILTLLSECPSTSVGALYIAPLKALINDQFERLAPLCREAGIAITCWHGDASAAKKRRLLENPSGILQITPESLEALLLRKHAEASALFADLRFIVIDELHALLRGDRGMQTFCLIERLCRLAGCRPRRVGLSATIGSPEAAGRLLADGSGRPTVIPRFDGGRETWRLSMEHFFTVGPQADEMQEGDDGGAAIGSGLAAAAAAREQRREQTHSGALQGEDPALVYIFERTRGRKCLIFSNSREECESVCQVLRQCCEVCREPDRFLIHHGNISRPYRESAEADMRNESSCTSVCATATLELGIDIGRLQRAFQIDAPFTVSGFLQRLGRTGRRGAPAEMWFVMREEPPEPRALLPEFIPWPLIQGIALVELYLEERFVEPPRTGRLPYSLLYHQTMSTLACSGELSPAALASRVLTLGPFRGISQDDYRVLLRHLLKEQHISRTESGGLIVGTAGERVINNHKFYGVFQENIEYTVHAGSEVLGTIVRPPPVGEKTAIAGRVWQVDEIDRQRRAVYCHLVQGRIMAYFGDVAGDIHTRILERMYGVLHEQRPYAYLMPHARARLEKARETFALSGMRDRPLVRLGESMWALFPWLGTYGFLALERLLKRRCAARLGLSGMTVMRPYAMVFAMKVDEQAFYDIVAEAAQQDFDPLELLYPREVPYFEKYDGYVAPELVRKGFACGVLDVAGMRGRVLGWRERFSPGSGGGADAHGPLAEVACARQRLYADRIGRLAFDQ